MTHYLIILCKNLYIVYGIDILPEWSAASCMIECWCQWLSWHHFHIANSYKSPTVWRCLSAIPRLFFNTHLVPLKIYGTFLKILQNELIRITYRWFLNYTEYCTNRWLKIIKMTTLHHTDTTLKKFGYSTQSFRAPIVLYSVSYHSEFYKTSNTCL